MTYNTLRIPKYLIQMLSNTELEFAVNHLEYNIDKIINLDKVSNIFYKQLMKCPSIIILQFKLYMIKFLQILYFL